MLLPYCMLLVSCLQLIISLLETAENSLSHARQLVQVVSDTTLSSARPGIPGRRSGRAGSRRGATSQHGSRGEGLPEGEDLLLAPESEEWELPASWRLATTRKRQVDGDDGEALVYGGDTHPGSFLPACASMRACTSLLCSTGPLSPRKQSRVTSRRVLYSRPGRVFFLDVATSVPSQSLFSLLPRICSVPPVVETEKFTRSGLFEVLRLSLDDLAAEAPSAAHADSFRLRTVSECAFFGGFAQGEDQRPVFGVHAGSLLTVGDRTGAARLSSVKVPVCCWRRFFLLPGSFFF